MDQSQGNISPINSEMNASEVRENLEEMFPIYYMHSEKCSGFKSSTTR